MGPRGFLCFPGWPAADLKVNLQKLHSNRRHATNKLDIRGICDSPGQPSPRRRRNFPCPWCLTVFACLPTTLGEAAPGHGLLLAQCSSSQSTSSGGLLLLLLHLAVSSSLSILAVAVAVVLYLFSTCTHCLPLTLVTHLCCARRFYWIAGHHQLDTGISILQTKHISHDIYALGRIVRHSKRAGKALRYDIVHALSL